MKNIYYNKKKKRVIDIVKKNKIKISNKYLLLDILADGRLDNLIKKITSDNVYAFKSPILPKGFLTGYEQFVNNLDNFINYILNYVNSSDLIKEIIINSLTDSTILLSKKYYYDEENIEYYKYNFGILIVKRFYKNLIKLKLELKDELRVINLNPELLDLNDKKCIDELANIIDELVFINKNDYKILSLFTYMDDNKFSLYLDWYKILIEKYFNNIEFIKEYRNYKKILIN